MSKSIILKQIDNANSQPAIKELLDKNYTKNESGILYIKNSKIPVNDSIDYIALAIDNEFDSPYHTGKCEDRAYDGSFHNFGKGKWSISGDNVPCSLQQAKQMASYIIRNGIEPNVCLKN